MIELFVESRGSHAPDVQMQCIEIDNEKQHDSNSTQQVYNKQKIQTQLEIELLTSASALPLSQCQ
jgi:hypothetical protein